MPQRNKPNGRKQLRWDDPLTIATRERDKDVLSMVKDALANNRGLLAYQPIVQSAATDKPAFYEGLIRIQDKTGRIIPAREFIDDVEDTPIGRGIDRLALELGLRTLADHPWLRLSINMSALSINDKSWRQTLDAGLQLDPTVGERLILEVTERSAMMMPDKMRQFMDQQQDRGVSFALDDFGAGYTALRYFKDFFFDILKIDGQFVRNIHANPDNQALTAAVVSIARHFDMFTVAEMVESEADAQFLVNNGVDCLQGYYFGVPTVSPYWQKDQSRQAG